MSGTPFHGTLMSTEPSGPKPVDASPVSAFSDIKRQPAVQMIRDGAEESPGQNATPRAVVLPVGSLSSKTSFPVSASSASTRPPAGRYMTPLTTIGVASGFTVGAATPPRPPAPLQASPAGVAEAVPRPGGALLSR